MRVETGEWKLNKEKSASGKDPKLRAHMDVLLSHEASIVNHKRVSSFIWLWYHIQMQLNYLTL